MTDIALFKKHFASFTFTDEDVTETVLQGQNSGLAKAKGYTDDTEVLTSQGWLLFSEVYDILESERNAFTAFDSYDSSRKELFRKNAESLDDKEYLRELRYSYNPLLVASVSPYNYDEDTKTRVGNSGRVVFTQPTGFHQWLYSRNIVRIKMRNIDIRMTPYAEVLVKKKYRGGYVFVKSNDMYENQYEEYFYLGLNKFNRSISETFTPTKAHIMDDGVLGWWERTLQKAFIAPDGRINPEHKNILDRYLNRTIAPNTSKSTTGNVPGLEDIVLSYLPQSIIPTEINLEGRGAEIYPSEYITRYTGYKGSVYNLTVPPYKTLIVRKHKPDEGDNRWKWIGKPVVVGDASNKHLPDNGSFLTGSSHSVKNRK
jgi:hypothetical protein